MGQAAQLQVDNDQAAQLAMEEQQIHPIPGLVDTQAPLPPDEGEAFTQLQQEVFQPLNQGRFQVGFRILVLEVEELQHIRVDRKSVVSGRSVSVRVILGELLIQ